MAISGSLNFLSASIVGSYIISGDRYYGRDTLAAASAEFIPNDFVGLNMNIYEPITASTNTLGYPNLTAESTTDFNFRGGLVDKLSTTYVGIPKILNGILTNRNGPYQHPSWKQYRGWQHPVARSMRLNNTMSIDIRQPRKDLSLTDKNWLQKSQRLEKTKYGHGYYHNLRFPRGPKLRHYYEPSVISKHHPYIYEIMYNTDVNTAEIATARQTLTNQMMFFTEKKLNEYLKIGSINPSTASANSYPKQGLYSAVWTAGMLGASRYRYTETIFPRVASTYRPFKLVKPNYEEVSGVGSNGYDRAINRSFWRSSQGGFASEATSSAHSRLRGGCSLALGGEGREPTALNSQEYTQKHGMPNLAISTPASRKVFGGNQYPDADDPNPNLDSDLPGTGHWHRNIDFITNGIVANAVNTLTGGVDAYGNASSQPYGGFVQLESYQPYNISLASMWPLDPREDAHSQAVLRAAGSPAYLTSSIGGKGLQIGLTPHRISGSTTTQAQTVNVFTLTSHAISDQINITVPTAAGGNNQTYTIMFEAVDATGAASAAAYRLVVGESTGPSDSTVAETLVDMINGHTGTGNGTYGHNFAASGDVAGTGIAGITATLYGTEGVTLTADNAGSAGNSITIADAAGAAVARATGDGATTLMNGFDANDAICQFTGSTVFTATRTLLTGNAGELVYSTKPTIFFYRDDDAIFNSGSTARGIGLREGYLTPTASLQYLRHTYPYNTPFFATNKIVGRDPMYNSYSDFIESSLKYMCRGYSIIPEFRISENYDIYEDFVKTYEGGKGSSQPVFRYRKSWDPEKTQLKRGISVPVKHRLNFLRLDGSTFTASSDIVSVDDLSDTSKAIYRYNDLSQSAIVDDKYYGGKNNQPRKNYAQREEAVNFYTKFSHTDPPAENFSYLMNPMAARFPETTDTIPTKVKFTCRAIQKLRPYSGFYPSVRTVQIGSYMSSTFGPLLVNQSTMPSEYSAGTYGMGTTLNEPVPAAQAAATSEDFVRSTGRLQAFLEPFMAPGILYNSIKSGIAVDYPIYFDAPRLYCPRAFFATSSNGVTASAGASASFSHGGFHMMGSSRTFPAVLTSQPNYRLPFEAIYDWDILSKFGNFEDSVLSGKAKVGFSYANYLTPDFVDASKMLSGYTTGSTNAHSIADAVYPYTPNAGLPGADGTTMPNKGASNYIKGINNYLAETMDFFLDDQVAPGVKFPIVHSNPLETVHLQTAGHKSYFCDLFLKMGKHQMMCEGPRKSGFGLDHTAEFQRSSSIRGYLYGPPIEIQPHGTGYDTSRTFHLAGANQKEAEPSPSEFDTKPTDATSWDPAKGGSTLIGQAMYKSYLAANLQDPAYQAYTPPYFYGPSNLTLRYQVEKAGLEGLEFGIGGEMDVNMQHIITKAQIHSHYREVYDFSGSLCYTLPSTSSMSTGSITRMKIDASIDAFNLYKIESQGFKGAAQHPVYVWYALPKWVCPVLDFSASYSNFRESVYDGVSGVSTITDTLKENIYHDETTGRSLWGGYGNDPYDNDIMKTVHKQVGINSKKHNLIEKGLYFGVERTYINSKDSQVASFKSLNENLSPSSYYLNFDSETTTHTASMMIGKGGDLDIFQKQQYEVGRIAESKTISEAVVIIPYLDFSVDIEAGNNSVGIDWLRGEVYKTREIIPGKHFLPIHKHLFENILSAVLESTMVDRGPLSLGTPSAPGPGVDKIFDPVVLNTTAAKESAAQTDCGKMIKALIGDGFKGGYQMPPEFDFIHNARVEPFQMIILPFTSELEKHDLMNIYQNIMPDISMRAQKARSELIIEPNREEIINSSEIYAVRSVQGQAISLRQVDTGMFLRPPPKNLSKIFTPPAQGADETTNTKFYKNLKFMVFKAKQRGVKDYKFYRDRQVQKLINELTSDPGYGPGKGYEIFDRSLLRSPMPPEVYGMNWPYDYFSLLETIKLDITYEV